MMEHVTPARQRKITPSSCDARSSFQSGEEVYVKSDGSWVQAVLREISSDRVVSLTNSGQEIICERDDVLHCSTVSTLSETHRLSDLSPLNEATVVHCLGARLETDCIYTRAGSTVIAVNPFREIRDLYSLHTVHLYNSPPPNEITAVPHIYEIAEEAFQRLHGDEDSSQCIIVSGESGAGKTVSAKHLLRYLTVVANLQPDQTPQNKKLSECTGIGRSIERRILDSNPLLEAFGNATTPRNDNSSRFGKFIQLQFHRSGHIQGASIETYLLEKTRVVHQAAGDCNFHIFYQLCDQQESDQPWLSDLRHQLIGHEFNIAPHSKERKGKQSLQTTLEAMTNIGLSETFQHEVLKVVAAILFLSNIEFTAMDEDLCSLSSQSAQMSFLERSCLELSGTELATCQATTQCCPLLGVSTESLEQVLLNRSIASGGDRRRSVFVKPVSIAEAKSRRDCLAMLLYSRLFDWLVSFINQQIKSENPAKRIGLLDIYGFEVFDHNSLEQLCINYANEKLQQHYVRHFLKDLQKEYKEERIAWQHIDYRDNQPCLDVLEGTAGVFGVLNEEVYLNRKSNPQALGERVLAVTHTSIVAVKRPKTFTTHPAFIIAHYAGDVRYDLQHVTTKNKDNIPVELVVLLQKSDVSFLAQLFRDFNTVLASGKKRKTVLTKFKASLEELLLILRSSDVHYVRCIKPNRWSKDGKYDQQYVIQQLKASGVLETVEVCRQGYASRLAYWDFLQRYGLLLREDVLSSGKENVVRPDCVDEGSDPVELLLQKHLGRSSTPHRSTPHRVLRRRTGLSSLDHTRKCCAAVMTKVLGPHLLRTGALRDQFGKNKIFLQQEQFESLEHARNELRSRYAAVLQRAWRQFVSRRDRERREAIRTICRAWRVFRARRERTRLGAAASCIQRAVRSWLARVHVNKTRAAVRHHLRIIPGSDSLPVSVSPQTRRTDSQENQNSRDLPSTHISSGQQSSRKKRKSSLSDTMSSSKTKQNGPISSDTSPSCRKRMSSGPLDAEGKRTARDPFSSLKGQTAEPGYGVDTPPEKKIKLACSKYSLLSDVYIGDGVVTRRKLAKRGMRFHTRESVLKNAHIVNRRELERGLTDSLLDQ